MMISADPVDAERQSANARMRSYGLVSTRPSDVSSPDGTRQGLSSQRVVGRHVLRNSLIPVVTFIGVNFGFLLGGAIVTETIFNIPGVGRAVFDGVTQREGAVVVGIITVLDIVFLLANLLVDLLYWGPRPADPVRVSGRSAS